MASKSFGRYIACDEMTNLIGRHDSLVLASNGRTLRVELDPGNTMPAAGEAFRTAAVAIMKKPWRTIGTVTGRQLAVAIEAAEATERAWIARAGAGLGGPAKEAGTLSRAGMAVSGKPIIATFFASAFDLSELEEVAKVDLYVEPRGPMVRFSGDGWDVYYAGCTCSAAGAIDVMKVEPQPWFDGLWKSATRDDEDA
jgi:hypothetical protein